MLSFCYIYLLICILLFFFIFFVLFNTQAIRRGNATQPAKPIESEFGDIQGIGRNFYGGWGMFVFFTLFLLFFSPSLLLPSPTNFLFPFASVRSGVPLNQIRDLGRRCKLPQRGLGQSPNRKRIRCTLSESHWWQSF